ncbi:winged helix DNA-binding protein [Microvirga sp. BT689]|uniref:winged helix DNA-binding protein n=1 Tax=Microvirga arvi TaxID=2778731 RepID=UPI001951C3AE|nr:winged helix DNA-binding protein [Microvirga arvi]MBM6581202.1 winged helix DNA-binding protein [Microvirga arvi]
MMRLSDEKALTSFIEEQGPAMTQFELNLNVAKNAFEQWVVRCAAAAGIKGFSSLELLVLHMVSHKNGSKRIADICFALKIEDSHLVSYALKKLSKADLVESKKISKDTFFSTTEKGRKMVSAYHSVRQRCLIRSLAMFSTSELDLSQLTDMLRVLSGIYEQAARNAETSI